MTDFENKAASRRFFFRKHNRIQKRSDFQFVYGNGRVYRRSLLHVFIYYHADTPASPTRIGITVTRKAGNAVHRNRARRLLRESFRLCLPELKSGYSIVVNAMRSATTASFADVDAQFRDILQAASIFSSTEVKG